LDHRSLVINTPVRVCPASFRTPPRPPALCSSHGPWNNWARRTVTRAWNGMLKTDGSTHFLHLPLLSKGGCQPCHSWIPVVWATRSLRARTFKTGQGREDCFGCSPGPVRSPDSWYHRGTKPRELCISTSSWPTFPPMDFFPWFSFTDRLVLSVPVVCLLARYPVSSLPEGPPSPPDPCVNLF
jgi:hypothetical protein